MNFGDTELQLTLLNPNRSDSDVVNEAKMLAKANVLFVFLKKVGLSSCCVT